MMTADRRIPIRSKGRFTIVMGSAALVTCGLGRQRDATTVPQGSNVPLTVAMASAQPVAPDSTAAIAATPAAHNACAKPAPEPRGVPSLPPRVPATALPYREQLVPLPEPATRVDTIGGRSPSDVWMVVASASRDPIDEFHQYDTALPNRCRASAQSWPNRAPTAA